MASPALLAPAAASAAGGATHQASQALLVGELADPLQVAWGAFDPTDPNMLQQFILAIQAIVQHFGKASGSAAASFYEQERRNAGVPGHYRVQLAPVSPDKVEAGIRWATSDLWSPEPDLAAIQSKVTGVVEKDVLDVGRSTILDAVHKDRKALGWARVPEPTACSFCALLATRGMVYKADTADFRAHDHCRCHAEPVFTAYEPSAQIREWQRIYSESTKGVHGPVAMRRAFRQALSS